MFPKHKGLREIIEELDAELKTQKSLNLGRVFDMLAMPPYGFNTASAGLAIGLFLAPRIETIGILYEGNSVTPSVWVNSAILKNFVDPVQLKKTELKIVKTDEWRTLFFEWENEASHSGRVACLKKARTLMIRVPIASEALNERYKNLSEKAEHSLEAIAELDKFLEQQDFFFENQTRKEDVQNLTRTGSKLVSRFRHMDTEDDLWNQKQIEEVSKRIDKVRKAVLVLFDRWLPRQSCISVNRVDSFRDYMIKFTGDNLKALGLDELAKKVETHALNTISDIQERQKVAYSVEAARAFMAGHRVTPKTSVSELTQWIEDIDNLKKALEKAKKIRDVPEIRECLKKLDQMKEDCARQEKEHWDLHSELMESSFLSIEEIETIGDRIRETIDIFAGQDPEFEDLKKLDRRLRMFLDDFSFFGGLNVSNGELEEKVAQRIEKVSEEDRQDEMAPEWRSAEEIYGAMLTALLEKRRGKSREWLNAIVPNSRELSKWEPEECRRILSETETLPFYIAEEDSGHVEKYRNAAIKRLSSLWLAQTVKKPADISAMPAEACKPFCRRPTTFPNTCFPKV